jgi:hypothetical protein
VQDHRRAIERRLAGPGRPHGDGPQRRLVKQRHGGIGFQQPVSRRLERRDLRLQSAAEHVVGFGSHGPHVDAQHFSILLAILRAAIELMEARLVFQQGKTASVVFKDDVHASAFRSPDTKPDPDRFHLCAKRHLPGRGRRCVPADDIDGRGRDGHLNSNLWCGCETWT